MKKFFISFIFVCFALACIPLAGNAYFCSANEQNMEDVISADLQNLELKAKSCVLMDKKSGKLLVSFNENEKLPMASMTKMMVLDLVLDEIYAGRLGLNDEIMISEEAAAMGGSQCFLDANKSYSVYELIKSVVVASANDSTVALAEAVSGSEKMFVAKMNERAKALGMNDTNFVNSTGLDENGHVSTARDMATIMREVAEHDLLIEFGKVWMYDMNHSEGRVTSLTNTNRLIKSNPDVVFAKTGHTDDAGFCITAFATRGDEELIACVMGEDNSPVRFLDCTKLLNYGFSNFENRMIIDSSKPVEKVVVKGAKIKAIDVFPTRDLEVLVTKNHEVDSSIQTNINEINAPLKKGEIVGEMTVNINGENHTIMLEIREDIEELTVRDIIRKLMD